MSDCEKDYDRDSDHEHSIPPLLADDAVSVDSNGAKVYKYRDYSEIEDEDDIAERMPSSAPSTRGSGESSIRVQKFPVKLYAILGQKEFHDIITWMPHGRAWKVLKPSMFESLVMPLFFEYSNYHSFNRLVNAWSFRRVSSGPDRGAYYHELFLRGKPNLHKYMRRLPKLHKKLPMKKGEEPDFYQMDKITPLPPLEDSTVPIGGTASQMMAKQQSMQQEIQLQHPQLMDQRIVTPPRPPQMQMPMTSPAPMAPMIQQPRAPAHMHAPHGRFAPQGMYVGQQSEVHGGYDEYDMLPLPVQMPPQPARSPMGHHHMAHPGGPKMRAGFARPMHSAHMIHLPQGPPPSMRQPQGMDLMSGGHPTSPPYMDQNDYWHQQQQQQQMQQQMQHMQQLHQMRMYERQQAQLTSQDDYGGYPNPSPQRY